MQPFTTDTKIYTVLREKKLYCEKISNKFILIILQTYQPRRKRMGETKI